MNWVDAVLGIVLALAFVRGFAAGMWKSLFSLIATALSFLGAVFCTAPAVSFVESQRGTVRTIAAWLEGAFLNLPAAARPYDGSLFQDLAGSSARSGWAGIVNAILQKNLTAVESLSGPDASWGTVLAILLAHLVVSGGVFLVLLSAFRIVSRLALRWLPFESPASFGVRLAGGVIQTGISLVWMAVVTGTVYPLLCAGYFPGLAEQAALSWIVAVSLELYQVLWPAIVSTITVQP